MRFNIPTTYVNPFAQIGIGPYLVQRFTKDGTIDVASVVETTRKLASQQMRALHEDTKSTGMSDEDRRKAYSQIGDSVATIKASSDRKLQAYLKELVEKAVSMKMMQDLNTKITLLRNRFLGLGRSAASKLIETFERANIITDNKLLISANRFESGGTYTYREGGYYVSASETNTSRIRQKAYILEIDEKGNAQSIDVEHGKPASRSMATIQKKSGVSTWKPDKATIEVFTPGKTIASKVTNSSEPAIDAPTYVETKTKLDLANEVQVIGSIDLRALAEDLRKANTSSELKRLTGPDSDQSNQSYQNIKTTSGQVLAISQDLGPMDPDSFSNYLDYYKPELKVGDDILAIVKTESGTKRLAVLGKLVQSQVAL